MAKKISLTSDNIKYLRYAFSHFFPEDTIYSADKQYVSGEFNWKNRADFIDFVYRLTGVHIKSDKDIANIKKAELALEELAVETENKEKPTESNMPDKEARELQEAEKQKREAYLKAAQEKAQEDVKQAIETKKKEAERTQKAEIIKKAQQAKIQAQEEIKTYIEDKKIYAKVETPPVQEVNENTKQFITQAKNYPQSFRQEVANVVKTKIAGTEAATNLTPEEIAILADKVANDTIIAINNPIPQIETNIQIAILKSLSKATNISKDVSPNPKVQEFLKTAPEEIAFFNNSTELSRNIIASIDNNLAVTVFGPDPNEIQVTLSPKPIEGQTHEIKLDQLSNGYTNLLESQTNILDKITSFGKDQAQQFLMGQARSFLDSQIAKLPIDSALSGLYNSAIGQQILDFVGLTEYVPFGDGFLGGFIQQIPGAPAFFEGLGNTLGIDFGISAVAPATEIVTETAIVTEGTLAVGETAAIETGIVATGVTGEITAGGAVVAGEIAAEGTVAAGGAAAGAATGAAIGIAGGPLVIITAAIVAVVGFVASVIPWDKVKKYAPYLAGAVLGLGAFAIAGPVVGVVAGLGTFGVASAAAVGPVTFATTGARIGGLFATIGGALLVTVGMPVLITILIFPILVAIILFIINAGAYVTPPTLNTVLSANPYIQVDKVPDPAGPFKNSDTPVKITYKITVTAKKSTLTNIAFENTCQVITTSGMKDCPSDIPADIPTEISPSTPYTFTYTETYSGNNYVDSIVLDTFKVTADAQEAKQQQVSGAASITIGTPPAACISIDPNGWPPEYYANIVYARSILVSKYTSYVSKVCMSYPSLPIKYNPVPLGTFWGWNHGNYIDFFQLGVKSQADALYTLTHELGHSFAWGNKTAQFFQIYLEYPNITSESPYCFYSATQSWNPDESMPESIALYVIQPRCGNVQQKWPIHYEFLMKYVFN